MAYNYVYSELNTNGMLMPILGCLGISFLEEAQSLGKMEI